jgi:hypothetical protein
MASRMVGRIGKENEYHEEEKISSKIGLISENEPDFLPSTIFSSFFFSKNIKSPST